MPVVFQLLFKLFPLESPQLLSRDLLTVEREPQDLVDVGLDESIDFLFGRSLTAQRFDCTVMGFFENFYLVRRTTAAIPGSELALHDTTRARRSVIDANG
jgi:hypothetical protein